MNVTVINIKDLFKYLVVLITSIFVIVSATSFFYKKSKSIEKVEVNSKNKNNMITCLKLVAPIMKNNKNNNIEISDEIEKNKSHILTKLLNIELGLINSINAKENINNVQIIENYEDDNKNNTQINTDKIELAQTNVQTQEVTENNIQPSYTDEIEGIKVKNQSSYPITNELINSSYNFTNTKDILIFHTHTCESYTPSENFNYTETGNFRTTDLEYSVARVGDELDKQLTEYGYNVTHDKTYHDYPAYTGSYDRSLNTVKDILNNGNNSDIIIDLHRDAVGSSAEYGPSVMIGEEKVAQLMFVMGTDGGGLNHPNWRENFKFAVQIQKKANEMYPGLFRPIILRNTRYNQHLGNAACIIEVGATGNTMEECLASMKYLAKVISEVVK